MKLTTIKNACLALMGAAVIVAWGQDRLPPAPTPESGGVPDADTTNRTFGNGILSENVAVYDIDENGNLSIEELHALQSDRVRQGRHDTLRSRWDVNRDGRIDLREREQATVRIRKIIEERRCRRFNEVDLNSDGYLIYDEFKRIAAVAASDANSPGMAVDLFKHLDHDTDRRISKAEFLRSLNTVRPAVVDPDPAPKPRSELDSTDNPLRPIRR